MLGFMESALITCWIIFIDNDLRHTRCKHTSSGWLIHPIDQSLTTL